MKLPQGWKWGPPENPLFAERIGGTDAANLTDDGELTWNGRVPDGVRQAVTAKAKRLGRHVRATREDGTSE
jgi:hypothetical protein